MLEATMVILGCALLIGSAALGSEHKYSRKERIGFVTFCIIGGAIVYAVSRLGL